MQQLAGRRSAGTAWRPARSTLLVAALGGGRLASTTLPSASSFGSWRIVAAALGPSTVCTSLVQQPGIEQFADQEADAAGGVEVVHVGRPFG